MQRLVSRLRRGLRQEGPERDVEAASQQQQQQQQPRHGEQVWGGDQDLYSKAHKLALKVRVGARGFHHTLTVVRVYGPGGHREDA